MTPAVTSMVTPLFIWHCEYTSPRLVEHIYVNSLDDIEFAFTDGSTWVWLFPEVEYAE